MTITGVSTIQDLISEIEKRFSLAYEMVEVEDGWWRIAGYDIVEFDDFWTLLVIDEEGERPKENAVLAFTGGKALKHLHLSSKENCRRHVRNIYAHIRRAVREIEDERQNT